MAKTTLGYGNFKFANFPQYHTKSVYGGPIKKINRSMITYCVPRHPSDNLKSNAGPSAIKNLQNQRDI